MNFNISPEKFFLQTHNPTQPPVLLKYYEPLARIRKALPRSTVAALENSIYCISCFPKRSARQPSDISDKSVVEKDRCASAYL